MALNDSWLNAVADYGKGLITHIGLHSSNPGTGGSNEVSGGGYTRQAVSWSATTGGSFSMSGSLDFTGPANQTVTHVGFWGGVSGGTFYGSQPATGDLSFNAAGQITLQNLTIAGSSTS